MYSSRYVRLAARVKRETTNYTGIQLNIILEHTADLCLPWLNQQKYET